MDSHDLPVVGKRILVSGLQFDILKLIYQGVFSNVYMLRKAGSGNENFVLKVERQSGCVRPVLKLDVRVLQDLRGKSGFPELVGVGRTNVFKFCVMRMVGPDLKRLMYRMPLGKFTSPTIYGIALQTLDRVQCLHEAGYLNRDVKASNFAVGLGDQSNIVYMLDFGLSRRFVDANGFTLRRRPKGPYVGTVAFASLAACTLQDQSRKDDVEGWLFMMLDLIYGCLPWYNSSVVADNSLGREWKLHLHGAYRKQLFANLPPQWDHIFELIKKTGDFEAPRYNVIQQLVIQAASHAKINLSGPFDWQLYKPLLEEINEYVEFNEAALVPIGSTPELMVDSFEVVEAAATEMDVAA